MSSNARESCFDSDGRGATVSVWVKVGIGGAKALGQTSLSVKCVTQRFKCYRIG